MEPTMQDRALRVLVLKADKFYAEAIRRTVLDTYPGAAVTAVRRVAEARAAIEQSAYDLLLSGVEMMDGDVFELLPHRAHARHGVRHVLIMTGRHEPHLLAMMRVAGVDGVFDPSTEEPSQLGIALRRVIGGSGYWSESVQIYSWRAAGDVGSALERVTSRERLILAVIGDGCDDRGAAERLQVSVRSIKTARLKLYRKLGVHDKPGIIRVASQLGFVVLTEHGLLRPGYSIMREAQSARQRARATAAQSRRRSA
jgi:DNA-binding NarL/FixJ family response regulator